MSMNRLRQNPGSNECVGARIPELVTGNSEMRQFCNPTAVDLHVADVKTAVFVSIQRMRIACRLHS